MKRFSVLAGADEPLAGYVVQALAEAGCTPVCILIDRRAPSAKDMEIYRQRTGSRLPPRDAVTVSTADKVYVDDHNGADSISALRDRGCRIVVNAGTPRILSPRFLESVDAVLNCHPGLLPKYRGCTAVEWSVYNDDPVGNTVHVMTAGIDDGPILRAEAVQVDATDDYVSTRVKVFSAGFSLLARATVDVISGAVDVASLVAQAEGRYWKPIDPEKMAIVVGKLKNGLYRLQHRTGVAP
jgi:folate-dependent phosphoribosylglycinamide formyltransferase PurN